MPNWCNNYLELEHEDPAMIERAKTAFAREGGYIFHSDHSVPPEVSFERYQWILRTARQYADT